MALKSLAVLSHKGGVGKTSISVNIAVYLAKIGKKVCLLEHDFHGPSLMTFFKPEVNWINDYLLGSENLEKCIQDLTPSLGLDGKLYAGFANPTPESIQHVIKIDHDSSMKMLHKLMKAKKRLREKPYELDYLILDSSPGTGFTTVNAMVVTDSSLFVVKLSNADIMGTSQMISGLYKQLKNRSLVLANMIPHKAIVEEEKRKRIQRLIEKRFKQDIGERAVEFLGWIPTDPDLQIIEFDEAVKSLMGKKATRVIYTLQQPDHIFSNTIQDLIPKIFGD